MKCLDCSEEILAMDAKMCPYCFSKNLVSDKAATELGKTKTLKDIENLESWQV